MIWRRQRYILRDTIVRNVDIQLFVFHGNNAQKHGLGSEIASNLHGESVRRNTAEKVHENIIGYSRVHSEKG